MYLFFAYYLLVCLFFLTACFWRNKDAYYQRWSFITPYQSVLLHGFNQLLFKYSLHRENKNAFIQCVLFSGRIFINNWEKDCDNIA